MKFSEIFSLSKVEPEASHGDAELEWISDDSRQIRQGSLFVCMPSVNSDSYEYIPQAQLAGAVAVLAHSEEGHRAAIQAGLASAWLKDFNQGLGLLCRSFWGDPTARLRVVGITGTNGKTTTAWMMRDALAALGRKVAYLGTLGYHAGGEKKSLENTTPFPVQLWQLLHEADQSGIQDFVMEVSSHALAERRLAGVRFDVGIFTNLSQDHLDYHETLVSYAEAKKLFFQEYAERSEKPFVAAFNVDDPYGRDWATEVLFPKITFGAGCGTLQVDALQVRVDSLELGFEYQGGCAQAKLSVGGLFNVSNALSAMAGLLALGFTLEQAAKGLEKVTPVPGRFEAVHNELGIGVLVDYAHTPDALEKLLSSARELKPNRLITVFGCGGDRDRTKRPKMASVTSRLADLTVVTSDNPRTEDAQSILDEITSGLQPGSEHISIIDRREAIFHAVAVAQPGDLVVIAGKGHEDYQIIGRTKYPMDDRLLAKEALEARAK